MQNFYSIFLLFFISLYNLSGQKLNFTLTGKVIENQSEIGIQYATIAVYDVTTNKVISGVTTDETGKFSLTFSNKNIYAEVSFFGFITKRIDNISFVSEKADLGIIRLEEDVVSLEEVTVRGEKSTMEFKLDKRVFNVGNDLSSSGASALEVLNNVPSVNVNIEGQVSLRGNSGVQILIDGKPSILANEQGNALGSITAEMIEKIEIITNPSAKYDAEGTSGIINIVLKKDERKGVNGSISLNTGIPDNHNAGLSLNVRSKKFNLFTQLGGGYRNLPNLIQTINRDLINSTELNAKGEEFRNENYYNLVLGTDYYINPLNVLTLSGSFAYEIEKQPSSFDFDFQDESGNIISEWSRSEVTNALNPKVQYELRYKRDFKDSKDHQLLMSAIGNYFGKDQNSNFINVFRFGSLDLPNQQTRTNFQEGKYNFNIDYIKPFNEQWTMETGMQYVWNNVSNDFEVSDSVNNEWIVNNDLTNIFEYQQNVLAVYGTGAYEAKKWGLKVGLRVENTELNTLLVTSAETNNQNFTNYFPSLHTSYKINPNISLQAGYSRRIYRPRLWDLNPFFNVRNNFAVRTGNPNLLPEFTDSYEIGSIFIFDKTSFNFNVYNRYTTEVIEWISSFQNNVNTTSPLNIGTTNTTGLEANFKYNLTKKVTLNGDANFNYFLRKGDLNDLVFDFNANNWASKLTSKFKLNKQFEFEVTGQYQSRVKTIQGYNSANIFADFGARYKIMNGRGIFNLGVRDVFASRIEINVAEQSNFYSYSRRQRGRFITLGFSYGFGKGEAMEFSGARRR